ncbi:GntR family transcriptional regulator [Lentibacillus sp. CBA3610]|uniref:GntR family transcriptional regulator n=1 Tax=Lentibacillus sp. CBA3610 TaxID=2518176 RepID=UPI0015960FA7|nr:GntR family transcriptional regulator [Lentibacillus sp. CBA3610]QKY70161.1 GntR family transcriptional regulator [Lentibacillus sp. CBA3610]
MQKIKRVSAKEQVLSALRKSIFNGDLQPEQEIRQEEIANRLGVSRMPVREAFQILDREGIIKIHHNRRVTVIGLTEDDVRDHYTIRAFLEGMAAEKACDSPDYFAELEDIHHQVNQAAENNDSNLYIQLNAAFHQAIWRASNSPRLYAILSDLWNGLQPQFPEFVSFQVGKALTEHEAILKAILNRDSKAAREHMEYHVNRSKSDFLDHFHLKLKE